MRALVRGLEQAERNIEDGISLIKTAEGALNEVHSMLQRGRELSVQAANDTNSSSDREKIQLEVNQLLDEIDEIAKRTEFNTRKLLTDKLDEEIKLDYSNSIKDSVASLTETGGINDTYTFEDENGNEIEYASAVIDFGNINSNNDVLALDGKGFHYTCATCDRTFNIKFVARQGNDGSVSNGYDSLMEIDISQITSGEELVNKIVETAYGDDSFIYDPTKPDNEQSFPNGVTSFVNHFSQLASDEATLYI